MNCVVCVLFFPSRPCDNTLGGWADMLCFVVSLLDGMYRFSPWFVLQFVCLSPRDNTNRKNGTLACYDPPHYSNKNMSVIELYWGGGVVVLLYVACYITVLATRTRTSMVFFRALFGLTGAPGQTFKNPRNPSSEKWPLGRALAA